MDGDTTLTPWMSTGPSSTGTLLPSQSWGLRQEEEVTPLCKDNKIGRAKNKMADLPALEAVPLQLPCSLLLANLFEDLFEL